MTKAVAAHGPVAAVLAILLAASAILASCGQESRRPPQEVKGGDPARGAALIQHYGCGTCHTIPGVEGADALVGPPLTHFARRGYIAGELENNAAHLQRWIRDPTKVEPRTAMPDLGVTRQDARDITAYLYTLE